jgi:ferredoxin
MKCVIIYFSGTGNTKYITEIFKNNFENYKVECKTINIENTEKLEDDYDIFAFGAPIYAGLFPKNYVEWISNNVSEVDSKKCIIFSTQGSNSGQGVNQLEEILVRKGFIVAIKELIEMPNNYYLGNGFKPTKKERIRLIKEEAERSVELTVKNFLDDKFKIYRPSKLRLNVAKLEYKLFYKFSLNWAKSKLSVDNELCTKCRICEKSCPSKNITIGEKISFDSKCISCQRCVHKCPVNAFLYKGMHFEQYKI